MGLAHYLGNGFKILFFDGAALTENKEDEEGFNHALILLSIYALLYGVGFALLALFIGWTYHIGALTIDPIPFLEQPLASLAGTAFALGALFSVAITFIMTAVFHGLAKAFGGKAPFKTYFATDYSASFAASIINIPVTLLRIIPFIGGLISFAYNIYLLIITIYIVRDVHEISTGRAIAVVLIPVLVLLGAVTGIMIYYILGAGGLEPFLTA